MPPISFKVNGISHLLISRFPIIYPVWIWYESFNRHFAWNFRDAIKKASMPYEDSTRTEQRLENYLYVDIQTMTASIRNWWLRAYGMNMKAMWSWLSRAMVPAPSPCRMSAKKLDSYFQPINSVELWFWFESNS